MQLRLKTYAMLLTASLSLGLFSAEATAKTRTANHTELGSDDLHPEVQRLLNHGRELLGRRYRSRAGGFTLDCSGFVSYAFSKLNIKLPRSSSSMSSATESIPRAEIRPGDLLFFKGRNARSSRVGHVALVVDVEGDQIMMIHSSTSRGVIIERYDSPYYAKRYIGAGRVAALAELIAESALD